jgi:pyrroloquinoline quinone (PQQ) biosynthesis protein C
MANQAIVDQIVAIREQWHTKKHPFFQKMLDGSLPLRALGIYMAQHLKFVTKVVPSYGIMVYRAPPDVRKAMVENLAEEEGIQAIPKEGHEPHDHWEMIDTFCRAAGLSDAEIAATEPTPAWWGRTLHYLYVTQEEPIGVVLAMQSTQEGQQVALNNEITIPSFEKHYGFTRDDPEIGFFVEHAEADLEHSRRQQELAAKYLDRPELQQRALEVCEEAVRLRWASISDLYRLYVLQEAPLLPQGVAA